MAIDRKTVEHVARLARLQLTEEELARYGQQLGAILDYIAKLEKLDLAGTEPLVHPAESSNVFRDDQPRPSLPRPEVLKNAPEKTDDFFIVPKVVE
ncbi:MAG TPA: Asp-tRNA(Asn)/Glu-tRNA(Gln) amidotransferase subunit GatC [Planctomycetota bacterium]|jgi:aspartyl-tRNA(Asn)/glutamyl-tRNA(Gln) amidotransferase subunit C|nr:Asp-tRNA(Asn)/Glu-tRNA(Gln) amidotransferase subunit GatC [Planctomycetota bacterium]